MTAQDRELKRVVRAAAIAATAIIAVQMGGKATRDALFLSNFDVSALPAMVIAAAITSLVFATAASRIMPVVGPARLIPVLFAISAVLLLLEWVLLTLGFPRPVAVLLYLHYAGLGALLISGFWSLVSERFDPRTAKRQISRIALGATLGGLLGGVLAERVAASVYLSIAAMLPILAVFHLLAAWLVLSLRPPGVTAPSEPRRETPPQEPEKPDRRSGYVTIARTPYLRNLVALVVLATVSEGLIDYVFKARATEVIGGGEDLLRLFAVFYLGVAVLTVVVQATASRFALQRLGLARTVSTLPGALAAGSAGALLVPGLPSVAIARGAEAVLRNSLYRPGFELLFTPISPRQKRSTKALVDVGVVRAGDAAGGAVVQATLFLFAAAIVLPVLLVLAIALSLAAVLVSFRLHRGYVQTLEKSLVSRAIQLDLDQVEDATTRTAVLQSVGFGLTPVGGRPSVPVSGDQAGASEAAVAQPEVTEVAPRLDPEVRRIAELRTRDAERVRAALGAGALTPALVPQVVPLLAWDEVVSDAMAALREIAHEATGQLIDRLLDKDEEFAVRRRIPLVLAACPTERALDGLFRGLEDKRFEVRYRCGRALSRLLELNPKLKVDRERAIAAVLREVAVDKGVWESHRLLDRMEDEKWSPVVDEVLRKRANRSLEHVFTVLALFLPRQPLKIAFRGLHTDDAQLRGTALEYLETALPQSVREQLWPFLEDTRKRAAGTMRSSEEILGNLLESNASIMINLDELRKRTK